MALRWVVAVLALVGAIAACSGADNEQAAPGPTPGPTVEQAATAAPTPRVSPTAPPADPPQTEIQVGSGLTVTWLPDGYELAWDEGTLGVNFYVFTTVDEASQIAVGRWTRSHDLPQSERMSEEVETDGRTLLVTTYSRNETRVWEDRPDGIRVEVVGRHTPPDLLVEVMLGLRYDPGADVP